MGMFSKLKDSLSKTRKNFVEKIESIVTGRKIIDEELYEELEEALIQADIGIDTSFELVENLRLEVKKRKLSSPEELYEVLKELIKSILGEDTSSLNIDEDKPAVIMVVGVNGVGKTTTIGKLAGFFKHQGKSVLLSAGDTFRAAAIEQLEIWGNRTGIGVIKHSEKSDPAAVVFDSLHAAQARKVDILIIDTAGRLHTKNNLMEELKKVRRVLEREMPGAPHEVLLILDATTGQNAISQATMFKDAVGVTGLVLTKLDGTAKGGIVIAIKQSLNIPIKLIGVGEGIDDLRLFDAQEFAEAIFTTE